MKLGYTKYYFTNAKIAEVIAVHRLADH